MSVVRAIETILVETAPNFKPKQGGATIKQLANAIASYQKIIPRPDWRGPKAGRRSLSRVNKKVGSLMTSIHEMPFDARAALRDADADLSDIMLRLSCLNKRIIAADKDHLAKSDMPNRGPGRTKSAHEDFVNYLARIYKQITGRSVARSYDWNTGKSKGQFNHFVARILAVLGIKKVSPDYAIRKAVAKTR